VRGDNDADAHDPCRGSRSHPGAARDDNEPALAAERPRGMISRQLVLDDHLDLDRIAATYDDGVLRVVVPVAEQAKSRKIEISGHTGAREINA